ncbi:fumarylacetoacetase [Methylobacterium oryzihabitans]|uniref:fumarylacetoacetase n=1 Tax=Methylobacterium oryzihabitans TaxID=2499852 RepID=A0A437PG64_9HYPH|nr:fumarylacetoacetase [Methylobacterium oryzihabitans]RVU21256.1 fumarylacetoacetase [Methylobacterium oryzihabitans]
MIDATHDPARRSLVASANGHPDFAIQNLPLGVFSPEGGAPRGGVAIGDRILDLPAALGLGLLDGPARAAAEAAAGEALNPYFALPAATRGALRARLSDLLREDGPERARIEAAGEGLLHRAGACRMHLPARIGDYTDFYAGLHHAVAVGRLFRPDAPLLPNYKHVPIGYHGRASSVVVSGEPVYRPHGQRRPGDQPAPDFGPCRNLDYELELGIWIGPGNARGEPVAIAEAGSRIAGFCLLNDWSARDIQAWEYQPLGPFLAKSFCTTVSPWVVTAEALAPFRIPQAPRPEGDPRPLPYLADEADAAAGALDIDLDVLLLTPGMREPERLARSNARHLYWTAAQLVAHHASNGCPLNPGDLLGTGTISGPDQDGCGSLLELNRGGREPVRLASGETRRFLEDGDTVILRATCRRDGFAPIGFGEARGVVTAGRAIG